MNARIQSAVAQTTRTISDMGFGSSNAQRVEDLIRKIRPNSPLLGHGNEIMQYAKQYNLDPLMIMVTMSESQLCTDGMNTPSANPPNYNCANITWEAAKEMPNYSQWKATEGGSSLGHNWTFIPDMKDGIGFFFNFISYRFNGMTLEQFWNTHNPCSDPATIGNNCGSGAMNATIDLIQKNIGPPCTGSDCYVASGSGSTSGNPNHAVSCVITKVGNPKTSPPPLPPECSSSGGGPCQTPPQPYPSDLKQEMINKWGITFNGYDSDHLKWAYEELYAVQGTKFLPLVKNAVIEQTPESISQQVGCPGAGTVAVRLHDYPEEGFKTLIIHELTHTLQWCQPDNVSFFSQIHTVIDQEGYVSNYSRTACLGGVIQANEDYADTVAYYLNPTAPEFTCGNGAGNPYADGKHPLHKALAEKIVGSYSCSK